MKRTFFLPFAALVLSLVSCNEPEPDPLVGCWTSIRSTPDMWTVYHLVSDGTGMVEIRTPDTCLKEDEFIWISTDKELFLIYKDRTADVYHYILSNLVLHLFNSEYVYEGSYNKKRDCR